MEEQKSKTKGIKDFPRELGEKRCKVSQVIEKSTTKTRNGKSVKARKVLGETRKRIRKRKILKRG